MQQIKSFFIVFLLSLFICSCNHKFSIQKRRYSKGFFVASSCNKSSFEKNIKETSFTKNNEPKDITDTETTQPFTPIKLESNNVLTNNAVTKNPFTSNKNSKKITQKISLTKLISHKKKQKIKNPITHSNKGDIFDFLNNALIGYYIILAVIAAVIIVFFLFSAYPPAQALLILVVGIIVLCLLAAVGKAFKGGF